MKKIIAAILVMGFSTSAFAISTKRLVELCREVGVQKVLGQAESYGVKVNATDVEECGVDNRPLNVLAKYVWFCATSSETGETVSVLTQKPPFGKCF